jgi:hypothetical protein
MAEALFSVGRKKEGEEQGESGGDDEGEIILRQTGRQKTALAKAF